jgi:hypothetical protein
LFKLFGSIIIEDKAAIDSLNKADKKARESAQALDKVRDAAKKMGTIAIAGAGAAAGGLAALTIKSGDTAKEIDRLSQMTGFSREAFQEWDYIMQQNGYSMEQASGDMAALAEKAMDAAAGAGEGAELFGKLGVSVTDSSGQLKSQEDIFNETITALQGMGDETERNAIASALLSTTGEELTPILNLTGQELEGMKTKAHDLGLVLSDEAVTEGTNFANTMNDTKEALGAAGTEIGLTLMPAIQGFSTWITENMPAIQEKFNGVLDAAGDAVGWIKDNMDWLIPVLSTALGLFVGFQIMSGINTLMLAFSAAQTAITTAGGLMNIVLAANPFTLIAIAIGVLIGVGVALYMNWDKIKEKAAALWAKIKEVWNNIKEKTSEVFNKVKEKVTQIFTDIKESVSEKIQAVKDKVSEIFTNIKDTISEKLQGAKDKVLEIFDGIKDGISEKIQAAKDKVTEIFGNIKDTIDDKINGAKDLVSGAIDKIKELFSFEFKWPKLKMPKFGITGTMNPVKWLTEGLPKLSVNWNAAGGVFSRPTIFGTSAGFQGVGEAGPEAIMPLSKLQTMLDWNSDKVLLQEMVSLLKDIKSKSNVIALDGDKLVGGVYDRIDEMVAFKQRENELAYGG